MKVYYNGIKVIEGDTVTKGEAIELAKYSFKDFDETKLEFIYTNKNEIDKEKNDELNSMVATIEKDGEQIILDADADSQNNIKMAVLALEDEEETMWITKDNKPIKLSKEDLQSALRNIAENKSKIIFKYRKLKDAL